MTFTERLVLLSQRHMRHLSLLVVLTYAVLGLSITVLLIDLNTRTVAVYVIQASSICAPSLLLGPVLIATEENFILLRNRALACFGIHIEPADTRSSATSGNVLRITAEHDDDSDRVYDRIPIMRDPRLGSSTRSIQ
eukprot:TRINITY_DN7251_c0_g1_i13.p2 TRINITY_DN7251_c0_g1~~TRINITY_DN7251_c0_g1_i13.p2  ORF type:complete len:137 (+),score=29.87 TRINITY_DN7251_c0_g1_i13:649-1059(+)